MGDSTYIDLHNLSQITMDSINVSNLNCESIITEDLTVNGSLLGLNTSTNSIFNYTYTSSSRTFNLTLQNQSGSNYIIITDGSGVPVWTLLNPYIYPLLSGVAPILYNSLTGAFSLDNTIAQNETFTGLVTITANTSSTISRSNQVYVQNTSANQEMYLIGVRVTASGYDDIRGDLSGNISFNPNTHRLTTGFFRSTDTTLSTMAGSLDITGYVNISTGNTYKINNVSQTFLNGLTTTATSTITHTFVSPNLQSNINNLSISNGLIANNTIQLAKINTSAYSNSGGSNLLTQYGSIGSLNATYYTNQSGNTVTNTLLSPGTSSATLGSIVSTLNLGETGVFSGVLTLEDTTVGKKGYIHQRTGTMYLDVTNSVGALINIGSGTNVNTSIRALSVSATLSANTVSASSTISGTQLTGSSGTSNTSTLSSAVPSLILGTSSTNDGVIKLNSTGTNYSMIQQNTTGLNIDSSVVGSDINIGTNNLNPNVNIGNSSKTTTLNGSVNFNGGSISYSSGRFNNIRKGTLSPMAHTGTIPYITGNWMPLGNTFFSTVLQKDITIRSTNSYVRISINIPLSNWGASATNRHLTICRDTSAFVYGTLSTTPLVGNNYGLYHTLPAVTYETIQFSYVDTGTLTQGTTYWYALCGRGSTANIVSPNIGNSNYAEITVEELY